MDTNEVAFRYLNTAICPAGTILRIAKGLSCLGIDVMLVGDPVNFWYDTKRASIKQMAKREHACLHCINSQAKLSQLLQNSSTINPIELKTLEKEISKKRMKHHTNYLWNFFEQSCS